MRASRKNGHAAATREEKKQEKYLEELVPGVYVSSCVPLVILEVGHKVRDFCNICHNSH